MGGCMHVYVYVRQLSCAVSGGWSLLTEAWVLLCCLIEVFSKMASVVAPLTVLFVLCTSLSKVFSVALGALKVDGKAQAFFPFLRDERVLLNGTVYVSLLALQYVLYYVKLRAPPPPSQRDLPLTSSRPHLFLWSLFFCSPSLFLSLSPFAVFLVFLYPCSVSRLSSAAAVTTTQPARS